MTIDEAIKHCEEVAESKENEAAVYNDIDNISECVTCAADHRQLAAWLRELVEAKRLLKAAVEFIEDGDCEYCAYNSDAECPAVRLLAGEIGCGFKWIHADEALALIGEDGEQDD